MPVEKTYKVENGKMIVESITTYETPLRAEFSYEFLLSQKVNIENDILKMQNELQKVQELITKAQEAGLGVVP